MLTSHTDLRLHHYLSTTGWDNDSVSAFCWSVSQPRRYFVRRTAVRAFQVAFEIVPRMRRPHCPIAFPVLTNYIGGKKREEIAQFASQCMKNPKVLQGQLIIQRATHHFSLKKALSGILLVIYMNISFVFSFQQLWNKEEVENEVTGKKIRRKQWFTRLLWFPAPCLRITILFL